MKDAVLIADDSEFFRDRLAAALNAESSLETLQAKNGKEVLDLLAGEHNVKGIVLEAEMPILGGKDVLKYLSGRDHAFFIVATGNPSQQAVLDECRRLGADEVLTKPVDVELLSVHLRQRINEQKLEHASRP